MKLYTEKTLLEKGVEWMNMERESKINDALEMLESLKKIIQRETQSPLINFLEILDTKTDKRNNFAHALNNLERLVIHYIDLWKTLQARPYKVEYQSKRVAKKEFKQKLSRKGRKLFMDMKRGNISNAEFQKEIKKLEKAGRLFKKKALKKHEHEKLRVKKQKVSVERQLSELSSWTSKSLFRRKNRSDKKGGKSSRNEKYASQTMNTPTKNNKEDEK